MNKLLIPLVIAIVGIVSWCVFRGNAEGQFPLAHVDKSMVVSPDIVFDSKIVDVGEHYASLAPFVARYPFRNKGNNKVRLEVSACCSSTVSFKENKDIYEPGESGEIVVSISPARANTGEIRRATTVYQEGKSDPIAKLETIAHVKRHWSMKPVSIRFGKVRPKERISSKLVIESGTDDEKGEIQGIKLDSDLLKVELISQERKNNRLKYEYEVSIKGCNVPNKAFKTNIVFQTTNTLKPEFEVPISAEFPGILEIIPRSLFFGQVASNETVERQIHITNNGESALKILHIETSPQISYKEPQTNIGDDGIDMSFTMSVPKKVNGIIRGNIKLLLENKSEKNIKVDIPWLAIVNSSSEG